jgi:hypothetical protein
VDSVAFGIDRRLTPDRELLDALAAVAARFEGKPRDLVCVFADRASDVQWFTFRATAWARDVVLSSKFFTEELRRAGATFVAVARDASVPSDVVIDACHAGEVVLEVRSDGVAVATSGVVDPEISRAGDAETFALAAIRWDTRVPWNAFADGTARVALRRDYAAVTVPLVEVSAVALPPVCVVRDPDESFLLWCERAVEVFAVFHRAAAVPEESPADAPPSGRSRKRQPAKAAADAPAVAAKRTSRRPAKKRR